MQQQMLWKEVVQNELDLKSKELSPQNYKIKELEETGAAKIKHEGLNPVVSGWSPSSLPAL